jgi:hypothetical protein
MGGTIVTALGTKDEVSGSLMVAPTIGNSA